MVAAQRIEKMVLERVGISNSFIKLFVTRIKTKVNLLLVQNEHDFLDLLKRCFSHFQTSIYCKMAWAAPSAFQ